MQKIATTILLVSLLGNANAQSRFEGKELSINGFRNPSVGAEFRIKHMSVHAGYFLLHSNQERIQASLRQVPLSTFYQ